MSSGDIDHLDPQNEISEIGRPEGPSAMPERRQRVAAVSRLASVGSSRQYKLDVAGSGHLSDHHKMADGPHQPFRPKAAATDEPPAPAGRQRLPSMPLMPQTTSEDDGALLTSSEVIFTVRGTT